MEADTTEAKSANEVTMQIIEDDEETSVSAENVVAVKLETNPVAIDLENKMAIVYNVLKSCISERSENVYYYMDYIINRLIFLTNLKKHILSEIMHKAIEPQKTDVLEESVLETPDKDYLIRQILVKNYVKNNKIPKTELLTHIIHNHCYNYQIRQQLKRSGYIWRRLSNTKRAIIVEHPKRAMQRQRYLQKIINYRKEKRNIVYIETRILTRADEDIQYFQKWLNGSVNFVVIFIAVANNNKGFLNVHVFFSKSIFKCQKLVQNYIIKNIIPSLSDPSVFILEDKPYYRKSLPIPTIESDKCEMIKWLQINRLPHKENFHRSELFDIIQKYKAKRDYHTFDSLLQVQGHEVLRRPSRTNYLNYYKPLWDNLSLNEEITIFITKKNLNFWNVLEISLINTEKSVLCEDLEMEKITDKILTMASNTDVKKWADPECDENEDNLAQEEYIIEIKNSFSKEELQVREKQILSEIEKFACVFK